MGSGIILFVVELSLKVLNKAVTVTKNFFELF
jgi:hypothetical protein